MGATAAKKSTSGGGSRSHWAKRLLATTALTTLAGYGGATNAHRLYTTPMEDYMADQGITLPGDVADAYDDANVRVVDNSRGRAIALDKAARYAAMDFDIFRMQEVPFMEAAQSAFENGKASYHMLRPDSDNWKTSAYASVLDGITFVDLPLGKVGTLDSFVSGEIGADTGALRTKSAPDTLHKAFNAFILGHEAAHGLTQKVDEEGEALSDLHGLELAAKAKETAPAAQELRDIIRDTRLVSTVRADETNHATAHALDRGKAVEAEINRDTKDLWQLSLVLRNMDRDNASAFAKETPQVARYYHIGKALLQQGTLDGDDTLKTLMRDFTSSAERLNALAEKKFLDENKPTHGITAEKPLGQMMSFISNGKHGPG